MTVHRVKFLTIKTTRCTNFSNLFLEWNFTCFGQFLCPSSGVLHCTHSSGISHRGLLTACEQDQDGTLRNCPKHAEFLFKNKFEKLVHLVGLIIIKINTSYFELPRMNSFSYWYSTTHTHTQIYIYMNHLKRRSQGDVNYNLKLCSIHCLFN